MPGARWSHLYSIYGNCMPRTCTTRDDFLREIAFLVCSFEDMSCTTVTTHPSSCIRLGRDGKTMESRRAFSSARWFCHFHPIISPAIQWRWRSPCAFYGHRRLVAPPGETLTGPRFRAVRFSSCVHHVHLSTRRWTSLITVPLTKTQWWATRTVLPAAVVLCSLTTVELSCLGVFATSLITKLEVVGEAVPSPTWDRLYSRVRPGMFLSPTTPQQVRSSQCPPLRSQLAHFVHWFCDIVEQHTIVLWRHTRTLYISGYLGRIKLIMPSEMASFVAVSRW